MAISPALLAADLRRFHSVARPRAALRKALDDWGARWLGEGHFAEVYGVGQLALKIVSNRRNACYLRFARFCRRYHAEFPCLPRVFHVLNFGSFSVVVMERLAHRRYSHRICPKVRKAIRAALGDSKKAAKAAAQELGLPARQWAWLVQKIEGFTAHHPKSSWDMHPDNMMFRGRGAARQWVLTDPITR